MPRPTPAESVMPTDWSARPSSSIAMQREVKSAPRAAVPLGRGEAEQPEVAELRDEVGGEVVVAVPLGDVRLDRVGAKSRTTLRKSSWSLLSSYMGAPSRRRSRPRVAGCGGPSGS